MEILRGQVYGTTEGLYHKEGDEKSMCLQEVVIQEGVGGRLSVGGFEVETQKNRIGYDKEIWHRKFFGKPVDSMTKFHIIDHNQCLSQW